MKFDSGSQKMIKNVKSLAFVIHKEGNISFFLPVQQILDDEPIGALIYKELIRQHEQGKARFC